MSQILMLLIEKYYNHIPLWQRPKWPQHFISLHSLIVSPIWIILDVSLLILRYASPEILSYQIYTILRLTCSNSNSTVRRNERAAPILSSNLWQTGSCCTVSHIILLSYLWLWSYISDNLSEPSCNTVTYTYCCDAFSTTASSPQSKLATEQHHSSTGVWGSLQFRRVASVVPSSSSVISVHWHMLAVLSLITTGQNMGAVNTQTEATSQSWQRSYMSIC